MESERSASGVGVSSKRIPAKTAATTKPTNAAVAPTALRIQSGTRTAESSATPEAASSDSAGESASQSTDGVSITVSAALPLAAAHMRSSRRRPAP
jgi:hypothetical protein